jgi:hypothetical protein
MASIAFPLNRNECSSTASRKGGELIQPEQLKLIDLGNNSMFGVLQDNRHLYVKQFVKKRTEQQEHLELVHVCQIDFASLQPPVPNKQLAVISQLVPLNRTDSILVNLAASKRYFVFNYVTGMVTKEILPLRGSNFKICSDWIFDLERAPFVTMYNANSIRRVDINTFEIKKNIELGKLVKPETASYARFPIINNNSKGNYQWNNKT